MKPYFLITSIALSFFIIGCSDNIENNLSTDIASNVQGQYVIDQFQLDGDRELTPISDDTDNYISLIRQGDSLVSVRLVMNTEIVDFSWNLQEQKVGDIGKESSVYEFEVEPGTTSLNNMHLYITEDRQLKAVFEPALHPNIKSLHAQM
ncbi:hypothetical protein [Flammeovirga pacifica]|uniref:Uncharacterized protein n=1 Tax=Flammeovirga pacifica TaxID=915059 RepID=A0A1S1Z140_FLAPC|nr:hypothetical protein [Flammeovirga pacifica]OHX66986.1 hypothetical protein NH26_11835 [Flammeovirga pacifica]